MKAYPSLTFGALALCTLISPALAERVIVSEIHYNPRSTQPEYVELLNNSGSAVDFAQWQFTNGVDYTFPDFSETDPQRTFMCAFERVLVTSVDEATFRAAYIVPAEVKVFGPYAGALSNNGERLELRDKNGVQVCRIDYNDRGGWPVSADGAGHSLRLISNYGSCADPRNWTASAFPGGTPGAAPVGEGGQGFDDPSVDLSSAFPILELGHVWKYNESGADLGTAWKEVAFNDSAWQSGPGIFGRESKIMPAPGIQTAWVERVATHYLRTEFDWQGGVEAAFLTLDAVLDDGLVAYLNGEEIGRVRLPDGEITYQTTATSVPTSLEATVEEGLVAVDVSGVLQQGTNVLAVEIHNNSATSSDLVFGAVVRVSGEGGTIVINEVKAAGVGEGFIEFYNPKGSDVSLNGFQLSDDVNALTKFTISGGPSVPAGGFATVGFTESGFSVGGTTTIFLSTPGAAAVLDGFEATLAADGQSVGRKPAGGSEWFLFADPTPGEANIDSGDFAGLLKLSEVHFTPEGAVDWVEIYGDSTTAVPLDGLSLASLRDLSDAVPLSGSVGPGAFRAIDVNFPPSVDGEVRVHLVTSGGTVLAADVFGGGAGIESFQSVPPGGEWFKGLGHTRDAANAPARNIDIVINEIMCDPPSDLRDGEYIELFNRGNSPVDLGGWEFKAGVSFVFPANTSIPSGGYLIVAANQDWISATYPSATVIGNYSNNLANEGELLRLEDANGNLADEVRYGVGGDWPQWANGDGSSLELIHPDADNDLPTSWRDSDESTKSSFQTFSHTGTYSNLSVPLLEKELWTHLVGDSHLILKEIELLRGGSDILTNAGRLHTNGSSTTGWLAQGTHHASHFVGDEFHVIADGHGDNRANKIELQANAMNAGDDLTLRFQARWVQGKPRIIFKTFEDSFVGSFRIPIPNNLGTPGAANTALIASTPAALDELSHRPAVPRSTENVVVSARVSGAVSAVEIVYRADSSGGNGIWKTASMNDLGAAGDKRGGDGIWSGQITDQRANTRIVQFYVRATAPGGEQVTIPSRAPERPAMYVVDDSEIVTDVTSYRWVVSAYDLAVLQSSGGNGSATYDYKFPNLSNSYKNMTLVVDETEVFYNCEIRPSGSPWHAGDRANLTKRGKWKLPTDKRLRGLAKLSWDNTPSAEGAANIFNNKVPRYILYLMGHEVNENEFCTVIENAKAQRNSVELFEPIGNDFLERNFGDDGPQGELYRPDDIFFFTDSYSKQQITNRYWWYAGDQWAGLGRYHSQWLKRTREADYDYTALINLLKTVDSPNNYNEAEISRLVDTRKIAMMAAMRGYLGDWDSFTQTRPKNAFFYRPPGDGKFQFFHHDSDLGWQDGGLDDALGSGGAEMGAWLAKPYVRRIFRYYLAEILDKFQSDSPRLQAWFDCEESVSTTYTPNQAKYIRWNTLKNPQVISTLGVNRTRAVSVDAVANTSADTISLTGDAGYRVWEAAVVGHPEATFTWTGETTWRIDGIVLTNGANTLQVVAIDDDGQSAFGGSSDTIAVTKTNDAAPFVDLVIDPKSGNVPLTESLSLDASGSYDPEGGALSFAWNPPAGLANFSDNGATATAAFMAPGLYPFELSVTDPGDNGSTEMREVAVYAPDGFSNFNGVWVDDYIEEQNVEARNNASTGSWWSLIEEPGKLAIHIQDDKGYPLGLPPGEMQTLNYIELGSTWSYREDNVDVMSTFAQPDYDDSAWPVAGGIFGDDSGVFPPPGRVTPLDESIPNHVTYYFRKEFEFSGDPVGAQMTLRAVLDDGARFWLNGQEIWRENIAAGVIDHLTEAIQNFSPEKTEVTLATIDLTGVLVNGTNVLAVDLHNTAAGSSDIVFAANVDITAQALGGGAGIDDTIHPWLKRDLPADSDWALQTDLELVTLQFGEFMTGLMVEVETDGAPARYAFGYRDGTELAVMQVTATGSVGTVFSTPYSDSDDVILRIRREGSTLFFDRALSPGVWENLHSLDPVGPWSAVEGGIFGSTDAANSMRVSFDYLMLIDPSATASTFGDLVITEVMYKPLGGSQHEFIEIYNAGPDNIDLTGFSFPQDRPVNEFVFPASNIGSGEYRLIVANQTAFLEQYGAALAPQVIGAWNGGTLSNGGEEITLHDDGGLVVATFIYNDQDPWPTSPDTDGTSLTLADTATGSTGNGSDWIASPVVGGTPGSAGADGLFAAWMAARGEIDPLAVKDGESVNNLLTYAFGIDLAGGDLKTSLPATGEVQVGPDRFLIMEYRRRIGDPDIGYTIEFARDVQAWEEANLQYVEVGAIPEGDGTERVTVRLTETIAGELEAFLRVRVTAP